NLWYSQQARSFATTSRAPYGSLTRIGIPLCQNVRSQSVSLWIEPIWKGMQCHLHGGRHAGSALRQAAPQGSGQWETQVNERGQHPMRRLKRDPMERAFLRGYQHGVSGKSRDLCPFTHPLTRQAWLNGWREGRGDNWDGLTGTAGIHRLNEMRAVG